MSHFIQPFFKTDNNNNNQALGRANNNVGGSNDGGNGNGKEKYSNRTMIYIRIIIHTNIHGKLNVTYIYKNFSSGQSKWNLLSRIERKVCYKI